LGYEWALLVLIDFYLGYEWVQIVGTVIQPNKQLNSAEIKRSCVSPYDIDYSERKGKGASALRVTGSLMAALPSSFSSSASQHYINPQNQMPQEEEAKASEAEEAVITLLIRHLPEAIPLDTLSRLFSHYGASSVRPCSAPKCVDFFFLLFFCFLLCFNPITVPSFSIALLFSFCLSAG
jgi:hypothetical protein